MTSPSKAHRGALQADIATPAISSLFAITRYYQIAQLAYDELMRTSHDNSKLDQSYVLAKRYCNFIMEAIPHHDYYELQQYKALQYQHKMQLKKVIPVLEDIVRRMDAQWLEAERKAKIAQEIKHQQQIEEWKRRMEQEKKKPLLNRLSEQDVQQSALNKLQMLSGEIATGVPVTNSHPSTKKSFTRYALTDDSETDEDTHRKSSATNASLTYLSNGGPIQPLPPPLLPPRSDANSHGDESKNSETNGTSGNYPTAQPPPPYYDVVQSPKYHPNSSTSIDIPPALPITNKLNEIKKPKPMRQLQQTYRDAYLQYQKYGKIQILPLDTYQGRVSSSTNGCTVISALVAARHLNDTSSSLAISNSTIQNVMDTQCGPYLREIRRKLGLSGHALIIPSDVHDHLVDAKILRQEYFAGAAGGNIVDPGHYGEFLKLLTNPINEKSNGKAAATLFFREHVISIVKFPAPSNTATDCNTNTSYFDLIDSLPTLNGRATRTRCVDASALEVLLQWYATRKFSDTDCHYIDRNPWNDAMADLDPRVFQGFVWST